MKSVDLEQYFTEHGRVKSAKISINKEHVSNGYGFVCFESEEDSKKAIEASASKDKIVALEFVPKDKKDI